MMEVQAPEEPEEPEEPVEPEEQEPEEQLLVKTCIRLQHGVLMRHRSWAAAGCAAWVHAFTNSGHA